MLNPAGGIVPVDVSLRSAVTFALISDLRGTRLGASGFGSASWEFESSRARHSLNGLAQFRTTRPIFFCVWVTGRYSREFSLALDVIPESAFG